MIELELTGNRLQAFWEAVAGLASRTLPTMPSEGKFIKLRRALRPYVEEQDEHKALIAQEHTIENGDDAENLYFDKAKMQNRLNALGLAKIKVSLPDIQITRADLPKERKTKENQEAAALWAADLPVEIFKGDED